MIVENLLDNDLPLLIVDTEGEYYPLEEMYELLLVGPSEDDYDRKITEESVPSIVRISLEQNIPVIIDISEFESEERVSDIIEAVLTEVFQLEKRFQKPYLLVVEEIHEYVPEQGGFDSLAETVIRIAKRGRKRGLGICGVSQRPAAVSKEFITQCDWLLWHRLTWENDVDVARRILGAEYGDRIDALDTGEAFLMADWEPDIQELQFLRKRTYDAGSTPGLEAIESGDRSALDPAVAEAIQPTGRTDDTEDVRGELKQKDRRIAQLETEVERLKPDRTSEGEPKRNDSGQRNHPQPQTDERHDHLFVEFAEFLVYLIRRVIVGLRTALWRLKRFGSTILWVGIDSYRNRRYDTHHQSERLGIAIAMVLIIVAIIVGLVWLGILIS